MAPSHGWVSAPGLSMNAEWRSRTIQAEQWGNGPIEQYETVGSRGARESYAPR